MSVLPAHAEAYIDIFNGYMKKFCVVVVPICIYYVQQFL